jgi:predicted GIY-YIG superfamily endonuclease
MSTNIYILKLQGGNYYVGKSADVDRRIADHFNGGGSAWTQKHAPVKVVKIIRGASAFDEDRYVKEYMSKYGIDKVRGGTYVSIHLDEIQTQSLQRELRAAADACTKCGRKGHFVADCYARTDINGDELSDDDDDERCYRCGSKGHRSSRGAHGGHRDCIGR